MMILTCQKCEKRYLVKDEMIGPQGRKVRCVSCDHTWFQKYSVEAYTHSNASEFEGFDLKAEEFSDRHSHRTTYKKPCFPLRWICLMISVGLLSSSLIVARYPIIHIWPSTKQVYESLGFSITPLSTGLKVENVIPLYMEQEGDTFLVVKGEVVNTSRDILTMPPLSITVRGHCSQLGWFWRMLSRLRFGESRDKQCNLQEWQHSFSENRLFKGERIIFETEPHKVISGSSEVIVRF